MVARMRFLTATAFLVLFSTSSHAIISCDDRGCSDTKPPAISKSERPSRGVSTSGIVPQLAAKVAEIQSACGSTVISAVRHTRVRGSGRMSLHASGRAVDMAGNPSCIYRALANWPGGYSTDYHRIRPNHVHISFGGREDGLRFAHWQPRRHHRVAMR